MKEFVRFFTLQVEEEILEWVPYGIVAPESAIEVEFMLDWIRRELQEDFGNDDINIEQVDRFFRAWSRIIYTDDGEFVFAPEVNTGLGVVSFFIHFYEADEEDDEFAFDFELIWESKGVACSLYESSIIEDLMKAVK